MFGCPAGFVNGNMFCGAHEDNIAVRLGEKACESALRQPGFRPFEPLPGRVMKEYVCLPHDRLTDLNYLESWFKKALDYAAALPPKRAKKRASRKVTR
jgi:TfoX/Sxy family transcriptional regulator of competence genes